MEREDGVALCDVNGKTLSLKLTVNLSGRWSENKQKEVEGDSTVSGLKAEHKRRSVCGEFCSPGKGVLTA